MSALEGQLAEAARGVGDGFRALSETLRQCGEVMRAFRAALDRWRRVAAYEYRRTTGRRAPGSERTARLRKKRAKALGLWEGAEVAP